MVDIRLPPKWIELNLTKRECVVFISSGHSDLLCQCGRTRAEHSSAVIQHHHSVESWTPSVHTQSSPTDAYGTMVFEGGHYPNKAHYVRLSYDTSPDLVVELMTLVWGVPLPKLLITIRGGNSNFELSPWLGQVLQSGLVKAAKATSGWILTNGLNKGVGRHIGNAVLKERSIGVKRGRVVTIGISPWGIVANRNSLLGHNKERTYSLLEHTATQDVTLNPRHSNFLLVDNGSLGKFGGESFFRRRLERCISGLPTSPNRSCDTPIICVVIEGGFYTLYSIVEYLFDEPPCPVVIFNGTGRTADLISYIVYEMDRGRKLEQLKSTIYEKMKSIYKIDDDSQCDLFFVEIEKICSRRLLVTIYSPRSVDDEGFDVILLASIFRSQHWTPLQQLSLTLVWDRVDIATHEVFTYGRDWSKENLEHAMMEALVSDRLQFINLLIEHGLNMQTFLTPKRLESLYSIERNHSKVMRLLLFDLLKLHGSHKHFKSIHEPVTLRDIGLAMNRMMGHIYKSKYIGFGIRGYNKHLQHLQDVNVDDSDEELENGSIFPQPFNDLFLWAVLTKRHGMALLLWPHGFGALGKALIAVKLNKYLGEKLEPIETSLSSEFRNYALEWETLSYELLDTSFKSDPKMARKLLTMELESWSYQTCLTLAVNASHRMFLGHPCCQILLADLWMGALSLKNHIEFKVILGILFPFTIFLWDYKSVQELKLLPHQETQTKALTDAERFKHNERRGHGLDNESGGMLGKSKTSFTSSLFQVDETSKVADNYKKTRRNSAGHSSDNQKQTRRSSTRGDPIVKFATTKTSRHEFPRTDDEVDEISSSKSSSSSGSSFSESRKSSEMDLKKQKNRHPKIPATTEKEMMEQLFQKTTSNNIPEYFPETYSERQMAAHHSRKHADFFDYSNHKQVEEISTSFETTKKELKWWKKFSEFQQAPITNFYRHTMAYIAFVCCLSYVILVPQDPHHIGSVEAYVITYLATMGLDIIREFVAIDSFSWSQKVNEVKTKVWTMCDLCFVIFFIIGVVLRFNASVDMLMFRYGMLIYRVSSIYWNLRLYKYMGVHKFLGPKLVMMSRMLKHMAYFAIIIFVVLLAFGLARDAIRFPDQQPSWRNIETAFLEPYVMMFGEVDSDTILQCGEEDQAPCPVGHWVIPLLWIIYMMVANILIVNVLIAVFNGIYAELDSIALELWLFQRFTFVMEFERKPLLPPPFIILCHIYFILKWIYGKCFSCFCEEAAEEKGLEQDKKVILGNDHSLKTFLSPSEMNQAFDFELDNVDTMYSCSKEDNETTNVLRKAGIIGVGVGTTVRFGGLEHQDTRLESAKGLAQLRTQIREFGSEMESQRAKLDKLIGILDNNRHEPLDEQGPFEKSKR